MNINKTHVLPLLELWDGASLLLHHVVPLVAGDDHQVEGPVAEVESQEEQREEVCGSSVQVQFEQVQVYLWGDKVSHQLSALFTIPTSAFDW